MYSLKTFYKSKAWEGLVQQLKLERVRNDGLLYCEECGKPIVKSYDCIGHHVEELTEQNVNDYTVALNPDNIKLIHFICHNKIHSRFGYEGMRKVYLVYGAPCSGKSTFVRENAGKDDLILDIDNIWQMISNNDRYDKPNRLKQNVFGVRDCLFEQIKMRVGKWRNAWIIGGYPFKADRERTADILGAELIFIDETKDICMERAMARPGWTEFVEKYFEEFQPQ